MRADVRAERYAGMGGDERRDSMMVGRLVRTYREGAAISDGGGERRWARREYICEVRWARGGRDSKREHNVDMC